MWPRSLVDRYRRFGGGTRILKMERKRKLKIYKMCVCVISACLLGLYGMHTVFYWRNYLDRGGWGGVTEIILVFQWIFRK
jgi:hypothetical protein